MRPEISVMTDHSDEQPHRVYWNHKCDDNNHAWQCISDIMYFLDQHRMGYTVSAFQVDQTIMEVPDPEHRTMIRLSFPLYVDQRKDDYIPF